uniref:efflux RND transporter permease subunit n=1 Tax=uncultured Bacteroides sp. TaxID=162156 RepID=UPI002AABD85E
MLNKIIYYSLHNRLIVLTAALLLMIAGIYTALHTDVDVFPDLNAPTVVIMTEAKGMAAEEVEQLVTFPVETAVNGASNVRRVRSSSTTGFSVVWVEFNWNTDIYLARQIVSEKLAVVNESLPPNVGRPTLGPQSSILGEVLIVGLTADSTSMLDLRTMADWTIRPRLLSTGGVSQVAVIGGELKEYQIQMDPQRMKHYNVSLSEMMKATKEMNLNANGGVIYEYGNEYIVRGMLSTTQIDQLGKAVVKTINKIPVLLEDVTNIRISAKEPKTGTASERGKSAVLLTVTKQPGISTIALTEKLETSLKEIQKSLPTDVKVSTNIFRQSQFIKSSINNVQKSLLEGGIFVVIILFLFLANVRTTLISLVTLPLSLLISILTLHYMGMTINTMSLGGMAIAIGSLVDDAIVDVENVFKRLRENRMKPLAERNKTLQVVFEASKEVRMPILNSTLIIIVSFIPLFFLTGMEGRMLAPLGAAFIVALLASTVVALTLTPVLCTYLLGKEQDDKLPKEAPVAVWLRKIYQKMLEWSLRYKRIILSSTIALFMTALGLFFTLGRSFLPAFNEGSFTINISSLPGISLEESDRLGKQAEMLLLSIPEIQTVARKTGRAELDEHALGVNVSELEAPFTLKERSRSELVAEVRERLANIAGANIEIGQPISHRINAILSGTKASIAIKLFGNDLNRMFSFANKIKSKIQDIEGISDLNVEQQIERPQLKITPKREILSKFGITLPEFAEFVKVSLAGEVISQVYEKGKSFDLTLKVKEDERDQIEKIGNLTIDTNEGQKIPLSYVAEIASSAGPNTINRENVKRKLVISANVSSRDLRSVVNDIRSRINEEIQLPEGYYLEYGGQFESEEAASKILALTSLISIVIIYLLLYHQ